VDNNLKHAKHKYPYTLMSKLSENSSRRHDIIMKSQNKLIQVALFDYADSEKNHQSVS